MRWFIFMRQFKQNKICIASISAAAQISISIFFYFQIVYTVGCYMDATSQASTVLGLFSCNNDKMSSIHQFQHFKHLQLRPPRSKRPHFICIPFVKKKIYSNNFFFSQELLLYEKKNVCILPRIQQSKPRQIKAQTLSVFFMRIRFPAYLLILHSYIITILTVTLCIEMISNLALVEFQ